MYEYDSKNITSDVAGYAAHLDPKSHNPWGAFWHRGMLWVANFGNTYLTTYNKNGIPQSTVINIPQNTTGMRWYYGPSDKFQISNGTTTDTARIIGVTNNGEIWGWNSTVDPLNAIVVYTDPTAVYKGFDIDYENNRLVVADLANGLVKLFDSTFAYVSGDTDAGLAAINYVPFNIYINDEKVYVAFALHNPTSPTGVTFGTGNGFIDVFDLDGKYSHRFANQGLLNAPWAMLRIHDTLLVGQFGGTTIQVYDIGTGRMLSTYKDCCGNELYYPGIWELVYVHEYESLFVTAGINRGTNGLIAKLQPCK